MTDKVTPAHPDARIVVVDDEPANVRLLEKVLGRAGYENITTLTDPKHVAPLFMSEPPDILLLDLNMPGMSGYEVLEELRDWIDPTKGGYLPVLVLTADASRDAWTRSLRSGAKDFLTKPFDPTEVLLRVGNLLDTRFLHREVTEQNARLDRKVRERTADLWETIGQLEHSKEELRHSQEETIRRLSIAAEFRDDETSQHIQRMSQYCKILALAAGVAEERAHKIGIASEMHDIGKLGIPDRILQKPGLLDAEERSIMERHSEIGYRILARSSSDLLQLAATIALTHHERLDGTGYPRKLMDEEIPFEGRVAAIADVFDALTTDRVYRSAIPLADAVEIMKEGRGTQFDADLLDHFFGAMPTVLRLKETLADEPPEAATA